MDCCAAAAASGGDLNGGRIELGTGRDGEMLTTGQSVSPHG